MDILIQAIMESLNEGTLPLAMMLIWIWRWDRPFLIKNMQQRWTENEWDVPSFCHAFNAMEQRSASNLLRIRTVKRKECPVDSDEDAAFLFS